MTLISYVQTKHPEMISRAKRMEYGAFFFYMQRVYGAAEILRYVGSALATKGRSDTLTISEIENLLETAYTKTLLEQTE